MRPTHPAPLRRHRVTQLLVKLRGVREQTLERFAAHCVRWPNGPTEFPLFPSGNEKAKNKQSSTKKEKKSIGSLLASATAEELEERLRGMGLLGDGDAAASNRACLRRHYPEVLSALKELCGGGGGAEARRKGELVQLTNSLKHGQPLDQLSDDDWDHEAGPLLHIPARADAEVVHVRLLVFAAEVLADVRGFVELCLQQHKQREGLFRAVQVRPGRAAVMTVAAAATMPVPVIATVPVPVLVLAAVARRKKKTTAPRHSGSAKGLWIGWTCRATRCLTVLGWSWSGAPPRQRRRRRSSSWLSCAPPSSQSGCKRPSATPTSTAMFPFRLSSTGPARSTVGVTGAGATAAGTGSSSSSNENANFFFGRRVQRPRLWQWSRKAARNPEVQSPARARGALGPCSAVEGFP
jgi:hypothetical protein